MFLRLIRNYCSSLTFFGSISISKFHLPKSFVYANIPEYIVAHYNGKCTVPLEINGTPEFQYTNDEQGNPIVKFLNWKTKLTYPDCKDVFE